MTNRFHGEYAYVGPPGCGKTTKLSAMVRAIVEELGVSTSGDRSPVVVLSLTKTAANEVAGRGLPIPKEAVGTLHSHAYQALDRPKVVTPAHIAEFNKLHPSHSLGSDAKTSINDDQVIDPYSGGEQPGDAAFSEYLMLRARRVPKSDWPESVLEFADVWDEWKVATELYDFTDLIESVLNHEISHPMSPEVVVADETQDFSALEFDLVRMWGTQAGALILAGDPYQSLYSWRGAHPEALMSDAIPEDRRHVLSQSYRVPKLVQDLAMKVIEPLTKDDAAYKYAARVDEQGETVVGDVLPTAGTWRQPSDLVALAKDLAEQGRSVMITATCAHMLRPVVTCLRDRAVPFWNPWRPADGAWNPLHTAGTSMSSRIESMCRPIFDTQESESTLPGLDDEALWWSWGDVAKFAPILVASGVMQRGKKKAIEDLAKKDKNTRLAKFELGQVFERSFLDDVEAAFETGEISSVFEVFNPKIVTRFRRSFEFVASVIEVRGLDSVHAPKIHVGTIHSFKGAEADDVILIPDLANKAAAAWIEGQGESWESVLRTFYVGVTRARRRVWIARACGYAIPIDTMRVEKDEQ